MSFVRVTQRSMTTTSLSGLQDNLNRLQKLQEQLSSGKALSRPSDSPTDAVTAMKIRSDQQRVTQYARNATDGSSRLGAADAALGDAIDTVQLMQTLVVQARSAAVDAQGREAIAGQIESLQGSLLASANTTYLDRPLFGGTSAVPQAYTATTDAQGHYLSTSYNGNTGAVSRTIAQGTTVEVSVPGSDAFGSGTAHDLFATAQGIASDLRTDPANLGARLDALSQGLHSLEDTRSLVGARQNRIDTAKTAAESRGVDLSSALSDVEGVDVPKTIMELQMQQVAYQAALGATAKVIQPTLMDYLR